MKKLALSVIAVGLMSVSVWAAGYIPGTVQEVVVKSNGDVYVAMKKSDNRMTGFHKLSGTGDGLKAFTAAVMSAQVSKEPAELYYDGTYWTKIKMK